MPILATWCISNNLGDALTPWLIEKITGQMPYYLPFDVQFPKYMVCGSVLNHAISYTTVWGAGYASAQATCSEYADIRAVRGPITARRVRMQAGIPVEIIGDPALLLPRFLNPEKRNLYKLGICPHYVHQDEFSRWIADKAIKLLNVFDTPEKFVEDLCSCEVVYSSSLHGLILADAYGIPSQWIEGTAQLGGDGSKFHDHLMIRDYLHQESGFSKLHEYIVNAKTEVSLIRPVIKHHIEQLPKEVDALYDYIKDNKPPDFSPVTNVLWNACPFKGES